MPILLLWKAWCTCLTPSLSPSSDPRPSFLGPATCLLFTFSVSYCRHSYFSLSSLAFPLWHQHQLYKFHLAPRLLLSHPGTASSSLASPSASLPLLIPVPHQSNTQVSLPGSALNDIPGATHAPFRRRLPAKRLQLLSCICMNKQLWRVQLKLLCKHSPKYVLHCIIPSNKDSGIRSWLSVLLMLHEFDRIQLSLLKFY